MIKNKARTAKFKILLQTYLNNVIENIKSTKDIPEKEIPAVGGIVRDKICFYLYKNYDMNFFMTRDYVCPDNLSFKQMKKFIDDIIDYNVIKEFYYNNKDEMGELFAEHTKSNVPSGFVIFDTYNNMFLKLDKNGIHHTQNVHNATRTGFVLTEEITINTVLKYINKELQNNDSDRFKFFKHSDKVAEYTLLSTVRE